MRPILVLHNGKLIRAECVNEERHDVFFVQHLKVRGVNAFVTGFTPIKNVIFLYGYSPTKDDYEIVRQMRGIH